MSEKGITLVGLVITIVIIIILATISMNYALGGEGLIYKVKESEVIYQNVRSEENQIFDFFE